MPFYFFIPELNLIIELDGIQHFKDVSLFRDTTEKNQQRDKLKMNLANKNGYSILRIYQDNVWNDKNNWREKLLQNIKKYDTITNICIGEIYNTVEIYKHCIKI